MVAQTYLLGVNRQGEQIVSMHVKRCYRLHPTGRLSRAAGDTPLLSRLDGERRSEDFDETDIVPFKGRTDLILMTKAWGRGRRTVDASIGVGAQRISYRVRGERRVRYRGPGSFSFSEPEPFESVEMRYENAYGGFDDTLPTPAVRHLIDVLEMHPGEYPRNPIGKGYVVYENRARLDGLELPNIEDPRQLLTPANLIVGDPSRWWRQPLPWSCNWFPKEWYPRVVHYRGVPSGIPENDSVVPEVKLGWLESGHARRAAAATTADGPDDRCADAASPALVLPLMRRPEAIELLGFTPDGQAIIELPHDPPRILVRALGASVDVTPVIHRILISTLEMGVYVVWHAGWVPPNELPGRPLRAEDTMATLLDGVDVFVDGTRILPLRLS